MSEIKVAEISEYEIQIQKNIAERKKMFEMLQLSNVKQEFVDVLAKPSKRKLKIDDLKGPIIKQKGIPNQVQSVQLGVKKHWYQSSIMTFYLFTDEMKKMQPNSKLDVTGVCIICEKPITGQIIQIRNWKNHLQNCHQEVPEWKEYIKKTQEIKEQRTRNSSYRMPPSVMSFAQKPGAQQTLAQPLLRMIDRPHIQNLKEVKCHVPPCLPLLGTSSQPSSAFTLNKESVAPYQLDSTISECCMIEESGLPRQSDPPICTIRTRQQSKRLRDSSTSFRDSGLTTFQFT